MQERQVNHDPYTVAYSIIYFKFLSPTFTVAAWVWLLTLLAGKGVAVVVCTFLGVFAILWLREGFNSVNIESLVWNLAYFQTLML